MWLRQAGALTLCLLVSLSMPGLSASPRFQQPARAAAEKAQKRLGAFGQGAELRLQLSAGVKLRGTLREIGPVTFAIEPAGADRVVEVDYAELGNVRYVRESYGRALHPDPLEVRRVALSLGAGEHVKVRRENGVLRGHLESFGEESFWLRPDGEQQPVEIAYSDVHRLRRNPGIITTVILVLAIIGAVVVYRAVSE